MPLIALLLIAGVIVGVVKTRRGTCPQPILAKCPCLLKWKRQEAVKEAKKDKAEADKANTSKDGADGEKSGQYKSMTRK